MANAWRTYLAAALCLLLGWCLPVESRCAVQSPVTASAAVDSLARNDAPALLPDLPTRDAEGPATAPSMETEAERTLVTTARIVVLPFLILMVLFQKASQSFTARKR